MVKELDVLVFAHDAAEHLRGCLLEQHRDRVLALVLVGSAQLDEALALLVVKELRVEDGKDGLADGHASDRHRSFDLRELHVHHGFAEPDRVVAEFDLRLDRLQQLVSAGFLKILRSPWNLERMRSLSVSFHWLR